MIISIRLDEETVAALDAMGGKRSDLIREAIGFLLERDAQVHPSASVAPVTMAQTMAVDEPAKKVSSQHAYIPGNRVVTRKPAKRDFRPDFPAVLAAASEHHYSIRDLAQKLGWAEMRLERVLLQMEEDGVVRFERGMVIPV